jgi:hypothetical protein
MHGQISSSTSSATFHRQARRRLATVPVTFVGFSALLLVFRETIGGRLTGYDSYFTLSFMQASSSRLAGLLPQLLAFYELSHTSVSRPSSLIIAVPVFLFVGKVPGRCRAATKESIPFYIGFLPLLQFLAGAYLVVNAVGWPVPPHLAPFAVALIYCCSRPASPIRLRSRVASAEIAFKHSAKRRHRFFRLICVPSATALVDYLAGSSACRPDMALTAETPIDAAATSDSCSRPISAPQAYSLRLCRWHFLHWDSNARRPNLGALRRRSSTHTARVHSVAAHRPQVHAVRKGQLCNHPSPP